MTMSEKNGLILVPTSFIIDYITKKIEQNIKILEGLYDMWDSIDENTKLDTIYNVLQRDKMLKELLSSIKT